MIWTLAITREEFLDIYGDTVDISAFERMPKDNSIDEEGNELSDGDQDLIDNFLPSKLWRLNNCYTIIHKKGGKQVLFRMNRAQHIVYAASLLHPRIIILKSRQQGISTFWLINFFDDTMIEENFNIGLMAQGKDEAGTLLDRVKIAWDYFLECGKCV